MTKARDDRKRNDRAAAWPRCSQCGEVKTLSDMGPVGSNGQPWCQDCAAEGELAS